MSGTKWTIPFLALILLIPVGMAYGDIDEANEKTASKINEKIHDLMEKDEKTAKDQRDLEKLMVAKKWLEARANNDTETMRKLSERLSADLPLEYTPATKQIPSAIGATGESYTPPKSFQGSYEKHWDCRNDTDFIGSISGIITGYSSAIYTVSNLGYTHVVTDGLRELTAQ